MARLQNRAQVPLPSEIQRGAGARSGQRLRSRKLAPDPPKNQVHTVLVHCRPLTCYSYLTVFRCRVQYDEDWTSAGTVTAWSTLIYRDTATPYDTRVILHWRVRGKRCGFGLNGGWLGLCSAICACFSHRSVSRVGAPLRGTLARENGC